MKKSLIVGLGSAAAALALFAAPAQARDNFGIALNFGFPAYSQPQPYVYAPPQYVYNQPQYVYTQPQYVYTQPQYVYPQAGYVYYGGQRGYHQRRDRDGDGVPNRFDRRPNNPYRY